MNYRFFLSEEEVTPEVTAELARFNDMELIKGPGDYENLLYKVFFFPRYKTGSHGTILYGFISKWFKKVSGTTACCAICLLPTHRFSHAQTRTRTWTSRRVNAGDCPHALHACVRQFAIHWQARGYTLLAQNAR